jgi:heat shock protein HslJ
MKPIRLPVLAAALLALAACAPEGADETPEAAVTPPPAAGNADEGAVAAAAAVTSELAGTRWRLVQIMEMNDTTHVPGDSATYTLALDADGSASMQADCNRGSGSWTSESAGRLKFGPVAATQALCPPESIGEVYLAQFQWVVSYVMKDGHLFLATMADGAIIEFEPADEAPAVATVLGEDLFTTDAGELQSAILTSLFDHYAAEHDLDALESEIDHFVETMEAGMRAEGLDAGDDLSPQEKAEVATMRREMGSAMIRQWKINRALHEEYGGRIIYQQMGPEPLDAYREFLQAQCDADAFAIMDPDLEAAFWRYFTDESMHDFMAPGSADEKRAFSVPPWERKPAN